MPMRDGVELTADVYRPAGPARPALLQRTPYDKDSRPSANSPSTLLRSRSRLRGRRAGHARALRLRRRVRPVRRRGRRRRTTRVAWAAGAALVRRQGRHVRRRRTSARRSGWRRAAQPAALRRSRRYVTPADYYEGWTYQGGAFQLGFTLLVALLRLAPAELARRRRRRRPRSSGGLIARPTASTSSTRALPLDRRAGARASSRPTTATGCATRRYDDYWRGARARRRTTSESRVAGAATSAAGTTSSSAARSRTTRACARAAARRRRARGQRLIVGPWAHGGTCGDVRRARLRAMSRGTDARRHRRACSCAGSTAGCAERQRRRRRAAGAALRDGRERVARRATTGRCPRARYDALLPAQRRRRQHAPRRRRAAPRRPATEPPDRYRLRPARPRADGRRRAVLPRRCHRRQRGPADQRAVEARERRARLHDAAADEPLEVTGPVELVLFAASSAPRHRLHREAGRRRTRRARRDLSPTASCAPATATRCERRAARARARSTSYAIDLWATRNVVPRRPPHPPRRLQQQLPALRPQPEHRRHDRRGAAPTSWSAVNRVHHDAEHPSCLVLPVLG